MKIFIIILCGVFFGCDDSDFFCTSPDANGLCISGQRGAVPTEDEINTLLEIIDEQLSVDYPMHDNMTDMLENVSISVEMITKPLYKGCEKLPYTETAYTCSRPVGGVNSGGVLLYIAYNPCLSDGALLHEILHSWERFILRIDPPHDHSTPYLWEGENKPCDDSVECRTKMLWRKSIDC